MTGNQLEEVEDSMLPQLVIHSPLDGYLVHSQLLVQMESTSDN